MVAGMTGTLPEKDRIDKGEVSHGGRYDRHIV